MTKTISNSERRNRAIKAYKSRHWGHGSTHEKQVQVPGHDDDHHLTEMGLLTELHFDPLPGKAKALPTVSVAGMTDEAAEKPLDLGHLSVVEIETSEYNDHHLSFDSVHHSHRLYFHLSDSTRRDVARHLWNQNERTTTLYALAKQVGGRHAKENDYPDIPVQPLGTLYYVTYFTLKEEENGAPSPSKYIHRMGEEGGVEPILAVSQDGNLWVAGGSYTCPAGGITH